MHSHVMEQLDRRHTGYDRFKYRVAIGGANRPALIYNFNEIREWCWTVWGSSSELDNCWPHLFKELDRQVQWCWRMLPSDSCGYIYLKSVEEASFFKLKWM